MPGREGYHWNRGAWRPSRRQRQVLDLLVDGKTNAEIAEALGISIAGFHKVVQVYSLQDYSLELKRTIEVPNRVNCTTYCQAMVLSRDERYLYYASRSTAPECGSGGDAAVCDIHHIVAVDLEDAGDPPALTELQRGCGVPRLSPVGADSIVVTCIGQYPVRGGWTHLIGPDGGGRTLELDSYRPLFNLATSRGDIVLVTESGGVTKVSPPGDRVTGFALPSSSELGFKPRVFYIGNIELGDDRAFIVYDDANFGPHDRKYGFVVFDLETMKIEGYGRVSGAEYYLPQGESVYLLRDGRIEVLDLATGRLDVLTDAVRSGVEVLLPGR